MTRRCGNCRFRQVDDGQDGTGDPYCLLLGFKVLDPEYVCPAHKARTGRRQGLLGQVDMFDARTQSGDN